MGKQAQHRQAQQAFEKQVVRLPDGRELSYYWFPEYRGPRPADGAAPAAAPARPGEER